MFIFIYPESLSDLDIHKFKIMIHNDKQLRIQKLQYYCV